MAHIGQPLSADAALKHTNSSVHLSHKWLLVLSLQTTVCLRTVFQTLLWHFWSLARGVGMFWDKVGKLSLNPSMSRTWAFALCWNSSKQVQQITASGCCILQWDPIPGACWPDTETLLGERTFPPTSHQNILDNNTVQAKEGNSSTKRGRGRAQCLSSARREVK